MSDFYETETKQVEYKDSEVLEVKLSTGGLLSAPPILHFTDYTMEDTIKLSTANEDNIIEILIEVLQARVQEDFDVRLLHENEFEEVLLTIYANFWSRIILEYPYPFEEEELKKLLENKLLTKERYDKLKNKTEVPTVDINIKDIEIQVIDEKIKEPIIVRKNKEATYLRLPRVGDYILAEKYTKKKFAVQDKRFIDVKLAIQSDNLKDIEPSKVKDYIEYEKNRSIQFLEYKQALLIQAIEVNGVKTTLSSLEDKSQAYRKLHRKIWDVYSSEIEKIKFGVNHEITLISPFTKEPVVRRCLFQVLDFIPTDATYDNTGYSVSFGDGDEDERTGHS